MRKLLLFNLSKLFMLAVMLLGINTAFGQATLPVTTSFAAVTTAGPGTMPTGYTQNDLGGYNGALKFDTAGDYLQLFFNATPGQLQFDLGVNNSFTTAIPATAVFTVAESVDGSSFTALGTYTNTTSGTKTLTPNINSRYIRWTYTTKPTSFNIALKNVSLAAAPAAAAVPVVTASAQTATVGTAFSYQVSATNTPTSYAYTGTLPAGLNFSTSTGLISGNLTTVGTASISVTATNSKGTSDPATISFTVAKGNQTITFGAITSRQYGAVNFDLTATASSSLPVTYSSSNTNVATISGSTVTIVGIGSTIITASQPGDTNYNAATSVDQTLAVTAKSITITAGSITIASKTYDSTNTATINGTPTLTGVLAADTANVTLSGTPSAVFSSVNYSASAIPVTVSGYTLSGSAAGNYTLVQPTGLTASISKATVTITGATAVDKDYDTTTAATITNGTLVGVYSADAANVIATTGTFSNAGAGTNLPITIVLTGTKAVNYTLTQPGITGNINRAAQTITFAALATTTTASASVTLTATASSGLAVTYTSSNTGVATIATGPSRAVIVAAGTTDITAYQAGNANYLPATIVVRTLTVNAVAIVLSNWNFTSAGQVATLAPSVTNTNIVAADALLTRGTGAPDSAGSNSFRTQGFGSDGISTANQDYFETKLTAKYGYTVSLATINAKFDGTGTYSQTPGASVQFAYSLDGTNFTLIGSPQLITGTKVAMPTVSTADIADLQNVIFGTTVTIRFYASGQTATGGFGFSSPSSTDTGFALGGYATPFDGTIWNTGAWSNSEPNATVQAVVVSPYDSATNGNITAKSLNINTGGTVNVATGTTVTVANGIVNNAGSGSFVIQNNGALVQTNNAVNTGSGITVNKSTNPLFRLDYTLWSAPITGQTLAGFSPETAPTRFYEYKYDAATNNETYFDISATSQFTPAKAYLIRMPNTSAVDGYNTGDTKLAFNGTFTGTANNGTVTIPLSTAGKNFTAVGNPYASPISLSDFFSTNSGVIDTGSGIYLWRKKNDVAAKSYAVLNLAGFVANSATGGGADQADLLTAGNNSTWLLSTGQGFFVKTASAASNPVLTFTNSMRRPAPTSGSIGFLRPADEQVSRLWLNLTGSDNAFSQTEVAYIDGATTGIDYGYDAKQFTDGSSIALYSIAAENNLVIQARPAFDAADVVPMGFVASTAGRYTVHLDHTDGVFSTTQDIYLKDNMLGLIKNIKEGDYTFTTNAGTYANRFEVIYNKTTLGVTNPELASGNVIVFKQGNVININSTTAQITGVNVYDVRGRKLYTNNNINAAETTVNGLAAQQQVLIVEVNTTKGKVSKKIIF